jgi:hypothetical protein
MKKSFHPEIIFSLRKNPFMVKEILRPEKKISDFSGAEK